MNLDNVLHLLVKHESTKTAARYADYLIIFWDSVIWYDFHEISIKLIDD